MNVTVIGAGNMGAALVKQLTKARHEVFVTSRSMEKARVVASSNPGATAVESPGAAEGAEVVLLATGYADAPGALKAAGNLSGKVLIDITNPLTADYTGLSVGFNTSAAEEISRAFPEVRVVKAFNTVFAQVISDGADFGAGNKVTIFYAGDDADAKTTVRTIIESMGFEAMDAGTLKNARYLEPLAGLNIYFAYGAGLGTAITPVWIHRV